MASENPTLSKDLHNWLDAGNPIVSMTKHYKESHYISKHAHEKGQLIYCKTGTIELCTDDNYWMLPPMQGVWIPPGIDHYMTAYTSVTFCSLYVNLSALHLSLPQKPVGINMTPLLRELLSRASNIPIDYEIYSFEERLLKLTIEEMLNSIETGLTLSMGKDKRLHKICSMLVKDPGCPWMLKEWGGYVGATSRTLSRLFLKETGMSFSLWRQHLRIIDAIPRLIDGQRVGDVADSLGYKSQTAFTVMFKRVTGKVPSDYIRCSHDGQ